MKTNREGDEAKETRLELKYCERCGALWFRECGGARTYCDRCLPELRELPPPWKFPHILRLPVEPFVEDDDQFDITDLDADGASSPAAGGVA